MKQYTTTKQAERLILIGLPERTADLFRVSVDGGLSGDHPLFKTDEFWYTISALNGKRKIFQLWSLGQLMFLFDKMFPRELGLPFNCVGLLDYRPPFSTGAKSGLDGLHSTETTPLDPVEAMVRQFESCFPFRYESLQNIEYINEDVPDHRVKYLTDYRKNNGIPLDYQSYLKENSAGII